MEKEHFEEVLLEFIEKRVDIICESLEFENQFYQEIVSKQKGLFNEINSQLEKQNVELCGLLKEYIQNTTIVISITNNAIYKQGVIDDIWLLWQYRG